MPPVYHLLLLWQLQEGIGSDKKTEVNFFFKGNRKLRLLIAILDIVAMYF